MPLMKTTSPIRNKMILPALVMGSVGPLLNAPRIPVVKNAMSMKKTPSTHVSTVVNSVIKSSSITSFRLTFSMIVQSQSGAGPLTDGLLRVTAAA